MRYSKLSECATIGWKLYLGTVDGGSYIVVLVPAPAEKIGSRDAARNLISNVVWQSPQTSGHNADGTVTAGSLARLTILLLEQLKQRDTITWRRKQYQNWFQQYHTYVCRGFTRVFWDRSQE